MTVDDFLLIVNIQTFLSGLIALLSFYKWNKRSRLVKLIGMMFAVSFLFNFSATFIFRKFFPQFVNAPASIYDITVVPMLCMIFNEALNKRYDNLCKAIAVIFAIAGILNLSYFQVNWIAYPNKLAASFVILFFGVIYFYRLMKDLPTMHLTRHPMFWFNSAFLIYGAGALFLFAFLDYLIHGLNNNMMIYWTFHNGLFIFQQLLIIIGVFYEMNSSLKPGSTTNSMS